MTLGIIFVFVYLMVAPGDAAGWQCKGVELKGNEQDKIWKNECMKEDPNLKTIEMARKDPCFRKCLMMKRGFVDELGMPRNDKVREYIQTTFPQEFHEELIPKYLECVTLHGPKIKESNGSCDSYGAIGACIRDKFIEVCGGK